MAEGEVIAVKPDISATDGGEDDYDSVMAEIKRKREERRRQQEEEEAREEEARKKREDERNARKLEREKKAKEREDAFSKELEEKKKKEEKEEERKKKKEERERIRLEEEQKEKAEEDRRTREREERRKALEQDQEEEKGKKGRSETKSTGEEAAVERRRDTHADDSAPVTTIRYEETPVYTNGKVVEVLTEAINNPNGDHQTIITKVMHDDDMKEELMKLLMEEHPGLTTFFSSEHVILIMIRYLTYIPPNPQDLDIYQVDNIMSQMGFARDAIAGTMPHLWKTLLNSDNRHMLDELFSLLNTDLPVLPIFHINCFWKALEFLIYRRGYEVSAYLLSRKDQVVPSMFKHLKDANVRDIMMKLIDNEAGLAEYREYSPTRSEEVPSWCDDVVRNIIQFVSKEDNEPIDEEIDNLCVLVSQILEKYPLCKLSHQLREHAFASAIIHRTFSHTLTIKHESTLMHLMDLTTTLFKASINTATYTMDILPPPVACMLAKFKDGPANLESPLHILREWLNNASPVQKKPEDSLPTTRTKSSNFSVFRVKCLQCVSALVHTFFKSVDEALQESGILKVCIDLFFQYPENNIVHCNVEDIVKQLVARELHHPDGGKLTEHVLSKCNLIERIVEGLSTKKALNGLKGKFENSRIEPPPFAGHVLNICKMLNQVAEKSVSMRRLIAECSGYRWGQVVLFKLAMKDSADKEWKLPNNKKKPNAASPTAEESESVKTPKVD